jgi:hypothetical protein
MTRPRPALSAASWGALWGVALGFWLLGPRLATVMRVSPANISEAFVFGASLAVVFALIGAFVGFEMGFLLLAGEALRRRPFADLGLAFALGMPPLLAAGYVGGAAAIERIAFGRIMGVEQQTDLALAAVFCLSWGALALLGYRWLLGRRSNRIVAPIVVLAALGGAFALPWRVTTAPPPKAVVAGPLERVTTTASPPLLFVGIDSANWRVLDSLVERGKVPFLGSLLANGSSGEIRAPWPPYWSAPAWGAIVTGHAPEETGIHGNLVLRGPGLPLLSRPFVADLLLAPIFQIEYLLTAAGFLAPEKPARPMLRRDPFWQMATRAGARTAVVRFSFTYPARGEASYIVSDRAGSDKWAAMGVAAGTGPELAFPPEAEARLLEPFLADRPDRKLLAEVLTEPDHPRPADAIVDLVEHLEVSLRVDEHVLATSERLVRERPDLDLLALYVGGFDNICHAFWPYRFPEDYPDEPPAPDDQRVLGPVVDRYLEFLDRRLAAIAAAFPRRPNVLIVSDHGAEASRGRTSWPGWHSPRGGVFLIAGPSVPRRTGRPEVSYFDVTSTAIDLLGYRAPGLERGVSQVAPQ